MLFLYLLDCYLALPEPEWLTRLESQALVFWEVRRLIIGSWGLGRVMRSILGLRVRMSRVGEFMAMLGCMFSTKFAYMMWRD